VNEWEFCFWRMLKRVLRDMGVWVWVVGVLRDIYIYACKRGIYIYLHMAFEIYVYICIDMRRYEGVGVGCGASEKDIYISKASRG